MKKALIIILCVVLVVLLFPVHLDVKDGGTVVWKSLTYELLDYHAYDDSTSISPTYEVGKGIRVFGKDIYKNTHIVYGIEYEGTVTEITPIEHKTGRYLMKVETSEGEMTATIISSHLKYCFDDDTLKDIRVKNINVGDKVSVNADKELDSAYMVVYGIAVLHE